MTSDLSPAAKDRYKPRVHVRGHPLADRRGRVWPHRKALWDKIGEGPHACHWCGRGVWWKVPDGAAIEAKLQCDHLDGKGRNNHPGNLVPSCKACNVSRANRGNPRDFRPPGAWDFDWAIEAEAEVEDLFGPSRLNPQVKAYGVGRTAVPDREGWIPFVVPGNDGTRSYEAITRRVWADSRSPPAVRTANTRNARIAAATSALVLLVFDSSPNVGDKPRQRHTRPSGEGTRRLSTHDQPGSFGRTGRRRQTDEE